MVSNPTYLKYKDLISHLEGELVNILSYWKRNSCDIQNGGFVGARDACNQVIPDQEKGAVLNARILWTFSAAYNFTKESEYLEMAHRAYDYLVNYFWDKEFGGLFWALTPEGEVSSSRKQIYAQGFGIYGFSEYYKATGNKAALDYAIQLYDLIEKYSCDTLNGGYIEALSRDWQPLEDMRLSDKDANEPKSMNTHLHILEPYTNLYRVWKSEALAAKIRGLIGIFQEHIINHKTDHFQLFFDYDWNVKSDIVSYGHDIEGAWLLVEAAYELEDANLVKAVERQCIRLVDATIAEGLASDGSIYNEKKGLHLDDDRHWWPQAEAMVGFVYAWKITGEERYLEKLKKTWDYIFTHIIDKENGEWFWRCDNAGRPNLEDVKLGFWKCPYHNSRALMEVIIKIKNGI